MALLLTAGPAAAADVSYWIEPCSVMASLACAPEDTDLARWAFAAWESASEGRLHLIESKDRATALLRLVWAQKDGGLYGETEGIMVQGRRGAQIHVLAEPPNKGDRLLRDAIVYLTCLHESGHALGLSHTRAFADIMYSFQYGGDIEEYFGRYRRKLMTREDIRKNSGMSPADRAALIKSIGEGIFR
ncbi:MAG TPA: hypothetical protein VGR73_00030 [Bryobacteraceae bacterium]|nr:hypothetical protein [Bryobacteraceae bacterium]